MRIADADEHAEPSSSGQACKRSAHWLGHCWRGILTSLSPLLPSSPRNQTACVLLLLTLFRVMALAADEFFSVILSQISQDLGLPPRLAGVTLLALGNGAPDLSASVAAVKSGNVE